MIISVSFPLWGPLGQFPCVEVLRAHLCLPGTISPLWSIVLETFMSKQTLQLIFPVENTEGGLQFFPKASLPLFSCGVSAGYWRCLRRGPISVAGFHPGAVVKEMMVWGGGDDAVGQRTEGL